ncbi:MAG: hypothetical protein NWR47_03690, partial [Aestuariivirgaceae bacterium]|nr:hypothetical protein [Aestuariivirgaceae bacterium]
AGEAAQEAARREKAAQKAARREKAAQKATRQEMAAQETARQEKSAQEAAQLEKELRSIEGKREKESSRFAETETKLAAKLAELELRAAEGGVAVGTATGLDVTLDAVEQWARGIEDRGFLLVPVSAAYRFGSALDAAPLE